MRKQFGAGAAILFLLTARSWAAETSLHACSLLTSAEIAGALGAKVGEGQESDVPIQTGPQKGCHMAGCMWKVNDKGMFSISVVPAAEGAAREAGLARFRQVLETLKARGWTEEKKESARGCAILTPPAAEKSMPISTGCLAEAKGLGISASAMGTKAESLEVVKALTDKAVSRLP